MSHSLIVTIAIVKAIAIGEIELIDLDSSVDPIPENVGEIPDGGNVMGIM